MSETNIPTRDYFLKTDRIGFSVWRASDEAEAIALWGDPAVTRFLCASGIFTAEDILRRLRTEIGWQASDGVQYWPIFRLRDDDLIGCCGLHPHEAGCYELGFHLRPAHWRQGYATEAARAVIRYAFEALGADSLFAGHHPNNTASRMTLRKLGFSYTGDELYPPTGLYHPSYRLQNPRAGRDIPNIRALLPRDKHDDGALDRLLALTDEEIAPLLPDLLTWTQDLNWPISGRVAEVIGKHARLAEPCVLEVLRGTDEPWKYNLLTLLPGMWGDRALSGALKAEIGRIAERPTAGEAEDEVDLAAQECLEHWETRREQPALPPDGAKERVSERDREKRRGKP